MDELEKRRLKIAESNSSIDKTDYDLLSDSNKQDLKASYKFEKQLEDALSIDVPDVLAEKIILKQRSQLNTQYFSMKHVVSLAASIMLVMFLFQGYRSEDLSDIALAHVYNELDHLVDTNQSILPIDINKQIELLGLDDIRLPSNVFYAGPCLIGKNRGMHIVAKVSDKPVTIFVSQDSYTNNSDFEDDVFSDSRFVGKIYPTANGSLIVIGESKDDIDTVYRQTRII